MFRIKVIVFLVLACTAFASYAETVTESWLRQAGISCGGGLSVDVQGEIDAAVIRRLQIGSIKGEGRYQLSEAESLLKQFQKEEKRKSYIDYVNCLVTLMNMASDTSQLPPREVILNSPVAVASLETVKRGQRFVLVPGDSIAVKNHAIIFTVDRINKRRVYYTWSNSETEKGGSAYRGQSQLIIFEKSCSLVPYKVDAENSQASFISNC